MPIITNNKLRFIIYGCELTAKEREQFDYYDKQELDNATFVKYKGSIYDIGEFMRVEENSDLLPWQGYSAQSAFHAILIKFTDNEKVIIGTLYS